MSASTPSEAGPSNPVKPPVVQPGLGNAIIVNPCQRLNPILEHIKNVSREFGDIVPDYQLGKKTCALFLSLKYHRLHPEYIHQRIQKLGNAYHLRILLVMCDISEHQDPMRELTKICLVNNITIMVCWSVEEAGTYLATYKAFEHKSPDIIKERVDKDYHSMLRNALTSINKVNKTDVETLRTTFGSFANIVKASPEQLRNLPGFGQVKVRRIKDTFEKPFRNNSTSTLSSEFAAGSQQIQAAATGETDGPLLGRANALEAGDPQLRAETATQVAEITSGSTRGKSPHRFGSAADMPPPPVPRGRMHSENDKEDDGTTTSNQTRRPRSPSPVWDIELDLNDDD